LRRSSATITGRWPSTWPISYTDLDEDITLKRKAQDGTILGSFDYTDGRVTALIDDEKQRIIYGYDTTPKQKLLTI